MSPRSTEPSKPLSPEEELEARRSELRKGLTDRQRLFLFGKLGGLNDKDAAIAAGYSVSVAENTKQRIWKPRVRAEFERFEWGSLAHVARSDDGWPLFDRTNRGRLSKV